MSVVLDFSGIPRRTVADRPRRRRLVAAVAFGLAASPLAVLGAAGPVGAATGPNYTVFAGTTLSLCGVHSFGDLTIQAGGTLAVASATSTHDTTGSGPDCSSSADLNRLTIRADHITNHGTIDGAAKQSPPFTPTPPGGSCPSSPYAGPTGNSGGGHAGAGGAGSSGSGGTAYANLCATPPDGQRDEPVSEVGAPGSAVGGSAGRGGGLVMLLVNDSLVSDGVITADGGNGTANLTNTNGTSNPCAHTEQTGVVPNGGSPAPAGAGAGGGIVLSATTLDLRGTTSSEIHAKGGRGGDSYLGASGGGGGGVVKVLGPIQRFDAGFVPGVAGGPGGSKLCPEATGGEPGGAGAVVTVASPTSTAAAPATFWNKGSNAITVPFSAAGAYQAVTGFTTILCGLHSTQPTPPPTFTVPASNSLGTPCGSGAQQLGSSHVTGMTSVKPGDPGAAVTVNLPAASDTGLWGVYTVTLRPTTVGQDCLVDPTGCVLEAPPATVDTVFGVDNSPPSGITVSADRGPDHGGWYNHPFTVTWSGIDSASGIVSCTSTTYSGPDTTAGSLTGTCIDAVGNTSPEVAFTFRYDATPPTDVHGTASRAPDSNGWYNHPVTVTFAGADATSGIEACTVVSYSGPDSAGAMVPGACTDKAGNTATATFGPLKYDHTPPTTTINGASTLTISLGAPVTGTVRDNLSGISSMTVTFTNSLTGKVVTRQATCTGGCGTTAATWSASTSGISPGLYRVTASSIDRAANAGPASSRITVLIIL